MSEDEAWRVLHDEGLKRWSWFESSDPRMDEAGIRVDDGGCLVYASNERATMEYQHHYDDESQALEDFLARVRADAPGTVRRTVVDGRETGL